MPFLNGVLILTFATCRTDGAIVVLCSESPLRCAQTGRTFEY